MPPVTIGHLGKPCDPPRVHGFEFHPMEGNLWLGEVDEATAQLLTRIPGFTRYGGKLKVPSTATMDVAVEEVVTLPEAQSSAIAASIPAPTPIPSASPESTEIEAGGMEDEEALASPASLGMATTEVPHPSVDDAHPAPEAAQAALIPSLENHVGPALAPKETPPSSDRSMPEKEGSKAHLKKPPRT